MKNENISISILKNIKDIVYKLIFIHFSHLVALLCVKDALQLKLMHYWCYLVFN